MARASSAKARSKPSRSISARSKRAQALSCGFVALMRRTRSFGQTACGLQAVEGFERAFGDDAAEIENHRFHHCANPQEPMPGHITFLPVALAALCPL